MVKGLVHAHTRLVKTYRVYRISFYTVAYVDFIVERCTSIYILVSNKGNVIF